MAHANPDGEVSAAADSKRCKRAKPRCKLVGTDGNVFSIIGRVRRALTDAGERDLASEFVQRATSARSYDEVLGLCFEYVDVR